MLIYGKKNKDLGLWVMVWVWFTVGGLEDNYTNDKYHNRSLAKSAYWHLIIITLIV